MGAHDIPKVEEAENHPGYNGKVGEVKAHTCPGGYGEGDVVAGSDCTVQSDSSGDNDISDRAGRSVRG